MKVQISKDLCINHRARLIHELAKRVLESTVMPFAGNEFTTRERERKGGRTEKDGEAERGRDALALLLKEIYFYMSPVDTIAVPNPRPSEKAKHRDLPVWTFYMGR